MATAPGLSSAFNAGFRAATHPIVVCTTDDVVPADDWLDRLLAPFARNDIDIVCGRVLPVEIRAHFHPAGAMASGPEEASAELDMHWFISRSFSQLPIQNWGTTANMAVRRRLLTDTQVGGFDPALGPGMPSGGGEAAYFFYKALRHGYKLRYQPDAATRFHCEGSTINLARHYFEEGKGHVAGQIHLFLENGDFRAVRTLLGLPGLHVARLVSAIRGTADALPPKLLLAELAGNIMGPYALWQSYRRSKGITAAIDPPLPY
jgi:GT2 family glycosyltransferase